MPRSTKPTKSGPELMAAAERYLAPLQDAGVDTLVLGCTHYPFLEGAISLIMGPHVTLVSSDTETAKDVYRELVSAGIERRSDAPPVIRYEATGGRASDFEDLAHRMLGTGVTHVELVETGAISLPRRIREDASVASTAPGTPSIPEQSRGRT
jgi:glutamate racemase